MATLYECDDCYNLQIQQTEKNSCEFYFVGSIVENKKIKHNFPKEWKLDEIGSDINLH